MSGSSQDSPDAKKPCKGILKSSSSFDKHSIAAGHRKSAKFDEVNVLQTYHPPDKDYGHMKIEEPKTPYNYTDPNLAEESEQLNTDELFEKLNDCAAAQSRLSISEDDSDEDRDETEEQKAKRLEFERRRKAHYKEFEAVKLARKLIEEELGDDEEEEEPKNDVTSSNTMDIDEKNKNL